jgi:urease accessory protein
MKSKLQRLWLNNKNSSRPEIVPGLALALAIILLLPTSAQAHEIAAAQGGGFLSGLLHPVLGLDHFLAMVSVGLLSVLFGGKAVWQVPCLFVGMMLAGGIWGIANMPMVPVELGIAFSVFALGVAIAIPKQVPLLSAMIFVGIFAVFHGYAHGAEMPIVASPVLYALGFVIGTASIHLLGIGVGLLGQKLPGNTLVLRILGGAIAFMGLRLLIA